LTSNLVSILFRNIQGNGNQSNITCVDYSGNKPKPS
jgi:hypothetical protein